jgi:hypothetical protein
MASARKINGMISIRWRAAQGKPNECRTSCAASRIAGGPSPPPARAGSFPDRDQWLQSSARHATIADVKKLLDREFELATVRAFVRRGGVLVVEGRAGMGKTAILDATCSPARRVGRLVLRARGSDLESDFACGVARQLLERQCTATTSDERAALFSGPAGAARALLMPADPGRQEDDTSFAVVHGLYWLVVNLATHRPILLAVDDAHWGDNASLRCSPIWQTVSMGSRLRSSCRCAPMNRDRRADLFKRCAPRPPQLCGRVC